MEKIAIDLTWLRLGKVGGTEFYIRNLLEGFVNQQEELLFSPVLFVAKDNYKTISEWECIKKSGFEILIAPVDSEIIGKRLIWQNVFQNNFLKKHSIHFCFSPTLFRPMLNGGIKYINTVHDIQAYHYPQYHPKYEVIYSKMCWKACAKMSEKVITISNFCKQDLCEHMKFDKDKVLVIYNAISVNRQDEVIWNAYQKTFEAKFHIKLKENNYYYTLCQMIPHKNIDTLLNVIYKLKEKNDKSTNILIVSGVSGYKSEKLYSLIKQLGIEDKVFITGFVSNEIKFTLMQHAKAFLFPSMFEGFGMPPVEAMMLGTPVITTRCTSIPEITQGCAEYVEDPKNIDDWIEQMETLPSEGDRNYLYDTFDESKYSSILIAQQYIDVLNALLYE